MDGGESNKGGGERESFSGREGAAMVATGWWLAGKQFVDFGSNDEHESNI